MTRETARYRNEENEAKFGGPRTESAFDVRMPETTSAQEDPQRITASRRENPYSGKTRGQVRVKTRLRCRTSQRKYKVVNYVDKKHLEWNTEVIEAMELEHVMSQGAQDLNHGETRHESGKLKLTNTSIYLNAKRCSGRNTANTSSSRDDSQAQQPDLTSRGGVLEE